MAELNLDQLTQRVAEFRKQREPLRLEQSASFRGTKARMNSDLKSENKRFISTNRYLMTLLIVSALALVSAQVGWIVFGQEPVGARTIQSDTPDPRFIDALKSPAADQLEERISSLTGNMETLSGLLTDLESKLIATDQVEERIFSLNENLEKLNSLTTDLESKQIAADKLDARITGLTENMETLNNMTTDLESRQMAADKLDARIAGLTENMATLNTLTTDLESRQLAADRLEERISNITKELQVLSDLAAGVESKQRATLATTGTVVPATQKLVSRTTELPSVAKEAPAVQTRQAAAPVTPDLKPVTDAPSSKRETSRTAPKEPRESVVSKEPAASVPQSGPWTINLISSPDKAYAVSFSDTVRSKGIRTELQEVSVKGTPYWRVQVTGFSTQGEAKAAADTVKDKLGLTDIWVMKR